MEIGLKDLSNLVSVMREFGEVNAKFSERIFSHVRKICAEINCIYEKMVNVRNVMLEVRNPEIRRKHAKLLLNFRAPYFERYEFVLKMAEIFPDKIELYTLPLLGDTEIIFEEVKLCMKSNFDYGQIVCAIIIDRIERGSAHDFFICANFYLPVIMVNFSHLIEKSENEQVRRYAKIFSAKDENEMIEIQKECGNLEFLEKFAV